MGQAHTNFKREVKKALIDRGLNVTDLARELGMTRVHVSSVINGSRNSKTAEKAICEYLGIAV